MFLVSVSGWKPEDNIFKIISKVNYTYLPLTITLLALCPQTTKTITFPPELLFIYHFNPILKIVVYPNTKIFIFKYITNKTPTLFFILFLLLKTIGLPNAITTIWKYLETMMEVCLMVKKKNAIYQSQIVSLFLLGIFDLLPQKTTHLEEFAYYYLEKEKKGDYNWNASLKWIHRKFNFSKYIKRRNNVKVKYMIHGKESGSA